MKLSIKKGATSNILQIFIADSSSTTGAGLTGLVYNTASLTAYFHRDTDTTATAISLVTMTVGTFTSSGFKEIDATNMPGFYQFCPPDTAFATGAGSVSFTLKGATNMSNTPIEVQLVTLDPQSATVTVGTNNDKTGYSLTAGQLTIKKNTALSGFTFPMFDSTTHQMVTGKTVTAQRSIDGAAIASCANAVAEVSNGLYKIDLANTDLNGTVIAVKFSASGCDDLPFTLVTQA